MPEDVKSLYEESRELGSRIYEKTVVAENGVDIRAKVKNHACEDPKCGERL